MEAAGWRKIAKNLIDLFFITTHLTLKAKSSTYYNATADPITFFSIFWQGQAYKHF